MKAAGGSDSSDKGSPALPHGQAQEATSWQTDDMVC